MKTAEDIKETKSKFKLTEEPNSIISIGGWPFRMYKLMPYTWVRVSRYPANCSIAIIHNIGAIWEVEEIKSILDFLGSGECHDTICHNLPSCIQVTVNNSDRMKVWKEAGFTIIDSYVSKGSGSKIYVMSYTYPDVKKIK